tara:strand:- start:28684 stop:29817 length:1134 start_codon:yes stop_codon:yes gene_type:complete
MKQHNEHNPFAGNEVVSAPNNAVMGSSGQANVQRSIAEVQAAIMLAKQFPRNKIEAVEDILNDCTRETLAKSAIYQYARGGTNITGPSIRLAEAIATGWQNIQSGWREVNREVGRSEIEAWAWDTQTNRRESVTFYVLHKRDTKKGSYALKDERDIYELCANQAARRLRACILKIVPGDVVEAAVNQCQKTLVDNIDISKERIAKMLEKFEEYGVNKNMIEARIQRRVDTIQPQQMVTLMNIYNSMRDGMSDISDWFDLSLKEEEEKPKQKSASKTEANKGNSALKDKLKSNTEKSDPSPEPEQEAEPVNEPLPTLEEVAALPHSNQSEAKLKAHVVIDVLKSGADKMEVLQAIGDEFTTQLGKQGLGKLKDQIMGM